MAEKTRPRERGAAAKPRRDKSRPPGRPSRQPSRQPSPLPPPKPDPQSPPLPEAPEPPAEGPGGSPPGDGDTEGSADVGDILAELLNRVMVECARVDAVRMRVPFTVSRARDAILCVAEWRFLARDEGDPDPGGDLDPWGDPDPERAGAWSEDEEPQPCALDSCAQGAVPVAEVPPSAGEDPLVAAEAGAPPGSPEQVPDLSVLPSLGEVPCQEPLVTDDASSARPGGAPGAVTVLGVRLSRGKVPDAKPPRQARPAAAGSAPACPGRVPGAVPVLPKPGPPRPQPRIGPRPPGKDPRPGRPPRPRPAPLCPTRPPAPGPAEPPELGGPRGSRGAVPGFGGHEPPAPLSARASLGSLWPGRPPRGTGAAPEGPGPTPGVARSGARRGSTRIRPQVKVLDVFAEPERPRPRGAPRASRGSEMGGPRGRPSQPGPPQPPPGPSQPPPGPPSPEPRPCDPWLGSALLAPGVTVRWGGSERRGPGTAGHGEEEEEGAEVREAERELRPILPVPAFRLAWDGGR